MLPPLPPSLVRHFIYPAYRVFRNDNVLPILEELERNQRLPGERIEGIQRGKLMKLLEHASRHAPYYRDLVRENNIRIDEIESPSDLGPIPFLTKKIIGENKERLVTEDASRKGYASSTGGSTGDTLYFYCDSAAASIRRANTARQLGNLGVGIGDRQMKLWGFDFDKSFGKRFADGAKNFFNNLRCISSFDMSDPALREYAALERSFKPQVIVAYPSALTFFSEFCRKASMGGNSPKAVV